MATETVSRDHIRFGAYEFDAGVPVLRRNGRDLEAPVRQLRLLALLVERAPAMVATEEIWRVVWPEKRFGEIDVSVRSLVYKLRARLGDDGHRQAVIASLRDAGYAFVAPFGRVVPEVAEVPGEELRADAVERKGGWGRWWAAAVSVVVIAAGAVWAGWPAGLPPVEGALAGMRAVTHDRAIKLEPLVVSRDSVYFTEIVGGHYRVVRVAAGGGETSEVEDGLDRVRGAHARLGQLVTAVSGDGTRLLVRTGDAVINEDLDAPLYVMPASGGTAVRVGNVEASAAAFTPDGKSIVFAHGDGVWECDTSGAGIRELAEVPGRAKSLAWSADGRRLRFAVADQRVERVGLWEWRASDGRARELSSETREGLSPNGMFWAGGRSLLGLNEGSGIAEVMAYAGDGWWRFGWREEMAALGQAEWVAFSPDGARTYLMRSTTDMNEVWRYDAAKSNFEPFHLAGAATEMDYSPDGRSVVYVENVDRSLWRANADGSGAREISPAGMQVGLPRWSPDGKWIAYYGAMAGQATRIYTVAAGGGEATPVDNAVLAGGEGAPTWSPDGKTIVFGTISCTRVEGCGIYNVEVGTGKVTMVAGSEGMRTARLSPDGRTIAAIDQPEFAVKVLAEGAASWRTVATGIDGDGLAWSRDGRYLYAESDRGVNPCIVRVDMARGTQSCYASLQGHMPATYLGLDWLGLGRGGEVMIAEQSPRDEVYELGWPGQ